MRKQIAVKLGLAFTVNARQYGYNHFMPLFKDSDVVAGAFPDVDEIALLSPAFQNLDGRLPGFTNGTQGPDSHCAMEAFVRDIADRNSYITYNVANFTSEEHRSFPYVHLSTGPEPADHGTTSQSKLRVWIQGAVHGNEPAGDQSVLALLGKFDANPVWTQGLLEKLDITVLPRYNPDGVFYFQRELASNYDPNRDHIKLARQQTRDLKQLFADVSPHIAIDMHEYRVNSRGQEGKYSPGADGLFSAAKNLLIEEGIRNMSETLFADNIVADMEKAGLRTEPYVTDDSDSPDPGYVATLAEAGTDGKIGRNAMGLTQAIVFLLEMRGIGLADQEFQRRTAAGLTMISSILETAVDNAEEVRQTVEGGIESFIGSNEKIAITDFSKTYPRPYTMVDIHNGSVVSPTILYTSWTPAYANLTRSRPEAYVIPVGWANIADQLRALGLEVQKLDEPFTGMVEALTIDSIEADDSPYEGIVRMSVTKTTAEKKHLKLPKGSFLVSTRQKNAALAMVALEPENIDSYVTFGIIPMEEGDEYPIYRMAA